MITPVGHNISFKQTILHPSIITLKDENKKKLDTAFKITNTMFPQNDVIFGVDREGELVFEVRKSNPMVLLLDKKVCEAMHMTQQQVANLINLVTRYKAMHNYIHNIKEPVLRQKTENIDSLDSMDIAYKVRDAIMDFNDLHPDELN